MVGGEDGLLPDLVAAQVVERGIADAAEDVRTEVGRQRVAGEQRLKRALDGVLRRFPLAGDGYRVGIELLAVAGIKGAERFADGVAHAAGRIVTEDIALPTNEGGVFMRKFLNHRESGWVAARLSPAHFTSAKMVVRLWL